MKLLLLWVMIFFAPASLFAVSNPGRYSQLEKQTKDAASSKLSEILGRYCGEFCQVVGLDVQIDDEIPDGEDMGFESAVDSSGKSQLVVSKLTASIQIDERVGTVNRDRLAGILKIHLGAMTLLPEIQWKAVKLPRITRYGEGEPGYILDSFDDSEYGEGDWDFRPQEYSGKAQKLRGELKQRLTSELNQVVNLYCPSKCIIERIEILGSMVSPKEAAKLPPSQQIRDRSGRAIFQIDNIEVDVTMDSVLSEDTRSKISSVMRSKVRFASPVNFNIGVIDFPESYSQKMAKEREDINDPYGLNKLRNMLIMFRDLASTKEVIRTTTNDSVTASTDQASTTKQLTENSKERANFKNVEESTGEMQLEDMVVAGVALLLVIGLIIFGLMKVGQSR